VHPDLDVVSGAGRVDILPTLYEGGAKVWECTLDLLGYVRSADVDGARVLDLGCGSGLIGIYALQLGARFVTLQDLNSSVLQEVTSRNLCKSVGREVGETRASLLAGDWESMLAALQSEPPSLLIPASKHLTEKYDVILSSETLYRPESYPTLCSLLLSLLTDSGVALFATKRFYFGRELGGGTLLFIQSCRGFGLIAEAVKSYEDGASNTRDIVRVSRPQK